MGNIESILQEKRVFAPTAEFVKQANVSGMEAYKALCAEAERDFEGFWARLGRENVQWTKPFTQVLDESNAPFYKWFTDGELNASANCLDRNLTNGNAAKVAIIFAADDGKVTKITYHDLHAKVCQLANGIKALGFKKGERAIIYMPMSIEVVVAMQACARLGITHSVVFGGFSAKSLQERIVDVGATLVIAADERRPRHVVARRGQGAARYLRAGIRERRASALHPLYLGLDRKTEGRPAHERRLSPRLQTQLALRF